jgi:hypothetical protein
MNSFEKLDHCAIFCEHEIFIAAYKKVIEDSAYPKRSEDKRYTLIIEQKIQRYIINDERKW